MDWKNHKQLCKSIAESREVAKDRDEFMTEEGFGPKGRRAITFEAMYPILVRPAYL
jgi:hypothetical protein